jgi:hypothetical protein
VRLWVILIITHKTKNMAEELKRAVDSMASAIKLASNTFQDFEAQEAVVRTAKYYESEDLWVINVGYLGETYILRPDSTTLPTTSTAEEVLEAVHTLLQNVDKKVAAVDTQTKTLIQSIKKRSWDDYQVSASSLAIGLINSVPGLTSTGELVYKIYNGYIDITFLKRDQEINFDNYELLGTYDAFELSADKLNPTPTTLNSNKELVAGRVITVFAEQPSVVDSTPQPLGYIKLAENKGAGGLALGALADGAGISVEGNNIALQPKLDAVREP